MPKYTNNNTSGTAKIAKPSKISNIAKHLKEHIGTTSAKTEAEERNRIYTKWLGFFKDKAKDCPRVSDAAQLHFTVLISCPELCNPLLLDRTRQSLAAQTRSPDLIIDNLDNIKSYLYPKTPENTHQNIPENNWTLLLHAGDTLEDFALLVLEWAIVHQGNAQTHLVYCDHDEWGPDGFFQQSCLKPDLNIDLLRSVPYMGRALMVQTNWALQNLPSEINGPIDLAHAYHYALTASVEGTKEAVLHLPLVLLHLLPNSAPIFATTSAMWERLAEVLRQHLLIQSPQAYMTEGPGPGTFHVIYPLEQTPLVSIVVPTRDLLPMLSRCIESLLSQTNYPEFEILLVDNDSQTPEARNFLAGLATLGDERIRVLSAPGPFNLSRINNLAVAQAKGELILMLNNDAAALQPDWLTHMVRHALRDGVGIVGARLVYPDSTLQHAGIIIGLSGPADHPLLGLENTNPGYMFRAQLTQNFSAVAAACLLVPKAIYDEVGGLDEATFGISYSSIDFCLRVGQTGRRVVWTPLATLLHESAASQKAGIEKLSDEQKIQRFAREQAAMYLRWPHIIADDPAYNPNLSLIGRGYELESNPLLRFDKLPKPPSQEHKIAVFPADIQGCGNYRIMQPMQAMLDAKLCTGGISMEIFSPNLALRSGVDTLVFQRPTTDTMLANLKALTPLKGIKKIYEVDDHLSKVPIKSAHYEHIPKDLRGRILKAIGLCDRLVVSTEPLAHELAGYNDDVRVMLNRLPIPMWGATPPDRQARANRAPHHKPRVGWAGGISHQGDLDMIADVIKNLADTVDWIFVGMCPDSIRPYVKEFIPGVPTLEYPAKLMAQDWDLAIAPLENHLFNECKSNLKLLEYGWCGVPVVCSDLTPYQCKLPATRVKNRYKDWRDAILERVTDLNGCHQEGLILQSHIANDWMLKGENLQDWYHAWID